MLAQIADLRLCALMTLRPNVCALMSGFALNNIYSSMPVYDLFTLK